MDVSSRRFGSGADTALVRRLAMSLRPLEARGLRVYRAVRRLSSARLPVNASEELYCSYQPRLYSGRSRETRPMLGRAVAEALVQRAPERLGRLAAQLRGRP